MPPIPVSPSLPQYEELLGSEKRAPAAYTPTSSPSIQSLTHSSSTNDYESAVHCHAHSGGCRNHNNTCRRDGASRIRRFLVPLILVIVIIGALIAFGCVGSASGYLPGWRPSLGSFSAPEAGADAPQGFVRRALEVARQVADPGNGQNGGGVFIDRKCTSSCYRIDVLFNQLTLIIFFASLPCICPFPTIWPNFSLIDTPHEDYLIIIFVGLFIVLILGIMLSAWCCKGSCYHRASRRLEPPTKPRTRSVPESLVLPLLSLCMLRRTRYVPDHSSELEGNPCADYRFALACLECIGCGLCAEGFEQVSTDGY
ncbi:hypothetical protein NMY22_g8533 [Coprinellus aureogranulatus]|nr:hypothetical protein NMY22_g8533 [Coprinellus aureogranulatus]